MSVDAQLTQSHDCQWFHECLSNWWGFKFRNFHKMKRQCWQKSSKGSHTIMVASNDHHGDSNYQQLNCLSNSLFWPITKKTSNLHITSPLLGNPHFTGVPSQRANNVESISISWLTIWQSLPYPHLPCTCIQPLSIKAQWLLINTFPNKNCPHQVNWVNFRRSGFPLSSQYGVRRLLHSLSLVTVGISFGYKFNTWCRDINSKKLR